MNIRLGHMHNVGNHPLCLSMLRAWVKTNCCCDTFPWSLPFKLCFIDTGEPLLVLLCIVYTQGVGNTAQEVFQL